ncbi:ficolin-1-B-like [Littorina saxatilis]|uniref:ficolin-1-B-like n=1 Tax=Littorina saxatilis TaxID=31220 RepID=UPI0038B45CB5
MFWVLLATFLPVTTALQWTDSLTNNTVMTVCSASDIHLPWNFTLSRDERIEDIKWVYRAEDGSEELIAILAAGHFNPLPAFSGRVQWTGQGGVVVSQAGVAESGYYTVMVSTEDVPNHLLMFSKSVHVLVNGSAANCVDWLKLDPRSGIRTVCISGDPITVYCDQTTDIGGWIVFQRRQDASVDFYRNWTEYRNGFGDLEGNFWLGLDALHNLTTSRRYQLRVDLKMWNETQGYATYSGFYVEGSDNNFTLHFDNFTGGNAGDSLSYHRGQQFSTKDRDHDPSSRNCAQVTHGAWWYSNCHLSNLNGDYKTSSSAPNLDGLRWYTFGRRSSYSMKFTEMKIRPII